MAISLVSVGGTIRATLINAIINAVNRNALNGIVPSQVDGSGTAVAPNGAVTFTGATQVSLNGVFSGSYDNYRITWNSSTRSSTGSIQFALRAAGVDATTNADYVKGFDQSTTRNISSSSSTGTVPLDQGIAAGQRSYGVIDMFEPALAAPTAATAQATVLASSAVTSIQTGFANENATSYDGFTMSILGGTATWSGTIRVYGYNTLT
jgi:hypothetical protein